jgi:caa(3)-type oxidase subunit IV
MSSHAESHGGSHAHPNYIKVYFMLVGLLVVSVVGPMLGIRVVTLIAAFGVALVKAYMVAKNFMHVNVEKRWIHWSLALALVFMVLLYAGVSPDVGRDSGQHWVKGPGWHHLPPSHDHEGAGSEAATPEGGATEAGKAAGGSGH